MNQRGTDRTPEPDVDPEEVQSKLRLAVARLRERLTAARNHGHLETLRRNRRREPPADHPGSGPGPSPDQ